MKTISADGRLGDERAREYNPVLVATLFTASHDLRCSPLDCLLHLVPHSAASRALLGRGRIRFLEIVWMGASFVSASWISTVPTIFSLLGGCIPMRSTKAELGFGFHSLMTAVAQKEV